MALSSLNSIPSPEPSTRPDLEVYGIVVSNLCLVAVIYLAVELQLLTRL